MNELKSILAIVPTGDLSSSQSENTRRFVENAINICKWLQCSVHFVTHGHNSETVRSVIHECGLETSDEKMELIIQSAGQSAGQSEGQTAIKAIFDQVTEAIEKYSCDLAILEDGSSLDPRHESEERNVLEASLIPILLIPRGFDFAVSARHSFLVPLSGEKRLNQALITSMNLAKQTASSVDLLHVTTPDHPCACNQNLDSIGDQLHHELQNMTDKITSESNPFATPEEQSRVRHFYHSSGFTSKEIIETLKKSENAILVLEWNGSLALGHAETIKDLLRYVRNPILFVRTAHEHKSRLKIGKDIRAA